MGDDNSIQVMYMKIICSVCKFEIKNGTTKRCPRCGNIVVKNSCENCRGCSLLRSCQKKHDDD
ncbi:MAG TPA: hypothetical protein VF941_24905 [Clostridia bacterium]